MISINRAFRLGTLPLHRFPGLARVEFAACRHLYSPAALGVDNYTKTRERIKNQFLNVEEKFRSKMANFVKPDSVSMVFTEDLKHMLHLVENNDNDLQLVRQMMLKFSKQNKDLRFGSFIFGPVIMRMYYYVNKPMEAYEMFINPEMEGFFDQLMTFQILMDLLFNNGLYNQMIEVFDIISKKQVQGSKYPKNAVVLVLAACYKLNTPESFRYAKNLWSELNKIGHYPMRRAGTFAAALALNQNAPDIALEIISSLKQHTYVTVRNLKVAALSSLDRADDTLPILCSALQTDTNADKKHTFCEEIIAKVKESIERTGKADIKQEFERLEKQLRATNQISSDLLDSLLCSEISASPTAQSKIQRPRFEKKTRLRPGLEEMY